MADAAAWAQSGRDGGNVTSLSPDGHRLNLRMLEAMLFASAEPLAQSDLAQRLPPEADAAALLLELQNAYAARGVNLRRVDGCWAFRTAEDLAGLLRRDAVEQRKLSRAALETLAVVAYHQPVTRADIEQVRGVAVSKGTLDVLIEAGWVRLRGRRRSPGRPVTFGTTLEFLDHFGLEAIGDLPGVRELKAAGLLDPASALEVPVRTSDDGMDLAEDEDPLEADLTGDGFADDERRRSD